MKIIHSIGAKFFGGGIGYIAYQRVKGVFTRGMLEKIIAPSFVPNDIDKKLYLKLPLSQILTSGFGKFMPMSRQYVIRDRVFDWNVSLNLPQADIFHGWSSQALLSIRKAKAKGQITFLERANSHPLILSKLMDEEYKKYSVNLCPTDPILLKIQLQELEEADFIIVPSTFAYRSFLEQGFNAAKLIPVPFGVDNVKFNPSPQPNDNASFKVVFTGQIGVRKGVHYLLQAWSELKLRNCELILAGWIHPDMVSILKRYNKFSNITIKNFTPKPQDFYRLADICVFPSIEDGFGLVVLEAMACGCPVIVTEATGAKDTVTEGQDGFIVPPADVAALKEKILYFYENREAARRMGNFAASKAKLHTWEIYSDKLISAYSEIYNKRHL